VLRRRRKPTLPAVGGISADSADLGPARRMQSLSCHRDERSVPADDLPVGRWQRGSGDGYYRAGTHESGEVSPVLVRRLSRDGQER